MINTEHANAELFAALAKAQGEIENASKNAANPHFRSKYADLAEVLNTIRPPFAANGLAIVQSPHFDGSMAHVTTMVTHSSGGYITSTASCVPAKSDAQGIGSATTYLRRYSAASISGIAQEDDDGNEASHNKKPAPPAKILPTTGVWESQSEESRMFLLNIASELNTRVAADPADAASWLESQQLDADEKVALWTRIGSKERSAIKKEIDKRKQSEKNPEPKNEQENNQ